MYYTIKVWYWSQYSELWWDLEYREKERESETPALEQVTVNQANTRCSICNALRNTCSKTKYESWRGHRVWFDVWSRFYAVATADVIVSTPAAITALINEEWNPLMNSEALSVVSISSLTSSGH